jgi:hypothetical protein
MLLSAFLFATLATAADNAADTVNRLDTAVQSINAADSAGSNGQISECFPLKDKTFTSDVLARHIKDARDDFQRASAAYDATRPLYAALNKTFAYNMTHSEHVDADSICAATPADVNSAHDLYLKLATADTLVHDACTAIVSAYDRFNKNYSGRLPKFAQYVPPRYTANCQESRANVKSVLNLLKQAAESCTHLTSQVSDAYGDAATLDHRLYRGCEEARHDEDEYLDEKEKEHEAQRTWERNHPIGAMICQGDPDCTKDR